MAEKKNNEVVLDDVLTPPESTSDKDVKIVTTNADKRETATDTNTKKIDEKKSTTTTTQSKKSDDTNKDKKESKISKDAAATTKHTSDIKKAAVLKPGDEFKPYNGIRVWPTSVSNNSLPLYHGPVVVYSTKISELGRVPITDSINNLGDPSKVIGWVLEKELMKGVK